MTKTIAYAYPTSPNAVSLGFGKVGCFYVAKIERTKNGFTEYSPKGFTSYAEAFAYAETLPEEYDFYSINTYHAKNGFVNAAKEVREFHCAPSVAPPSNYQAQKDFAKMVRELALNS